MYRNNTEKLFKWIFSAFVLIFPFFFLPQIDTIQALTQKSLLFFFSIAFLFVQLSDILISKRLTFKDNWMGRVAFALASSFVFSVLFSKNISLSFWGDIGESNDLLILLSSFIIFFSASSLKRRDIINILEYFVAGSAVLSIIFLIQKFTKINIALFTAPESSAVIISIAFVIILCFVFNNLRYFRNGPSYNYAKISAMGIFIILFLASLLLIGYKLAWLFVAAGMFFIFWRSMTESSFNIKRKKSILSLLMLLIFFGLFFLPSFFGKENFEQKLSYEKSWSIASGTLSESVKSFMFGSGLGTFSYDYSLYKGKDMGNIDTIFNEATFPLVTIFTTSGILGGLLILIFLFLFYKQGFSYFVNYKKQTGDSSINVRDLIFPVIFCASLLMFFYKIDSVFLFIAFFFFGLWNSQDDKDEKSIEIPSQFIKLLFAIITVSVLVMFLSYVKYCLAGIYYEKALSGFRNKEQTSTTFSQIRTSYELWKTSEAGIGLSQLYLIKASEELGQKWTTEERQKKQRDDIKEFSKKSEEIASSVCLSDSNNFLTWKNLGLIYENTNLINEDRTSDAIEAYQRAIELAPYDSDIYFSLGRLYELNGDDELALLNYEKCFELNPLNNNILLKKIDSLR